MNGEKVSSLRQLALRLGFSHTAAVNWAARADWPFGDSGPYSVSSVKSWGERVLNWPTFNDKLAEWTQAAGDAFGALVRTKDEICGWPYLPSGEPDPRPILGAAFELEAAIDHLSTACVALMLEAGSDPPAGLRDSGAFKRRFEPDPEHGGCRLRLPTEKATEVAKRKTTRPRKGHKHA